MGLLQSCFAKNNKVGVMKEEAEVYEKVRRAMVTEDVTEKKGGLAFGLTFVSEEEPKLPPRRLTELKKEDFEKWRDDQEKVQSQKQRLAQQRREEALIQKKIEVAHREMERLEKYVNLSICLPYNIQEAVLQQELILGIGKLIATSPDLFDGILKIRIGWFVRAMRFELEQDDEGIELHDLSPNDVKGMLIAVLVRNVYEADLRTPLQKRQLDGALNRVPKDFYDRVWSILEKTPYGIKVAGYLLPQTFMVVSTMLERNPEASFDQAVNMDKIIMDAFEEFQRDLSKSEGHEKQDEMTKFYSTPPNVKHGTSRYLTKAVINNLLEGEMKFVSDDMCSVS
uniref:Phosphorylase b kinase regulatory subunit n=1 Tax=Magallana gigas TaxID=29159 RepID=K1RC00_MAGGI